MKIIMSHVVLLLLAGLISKTTVAEPATVVNEAELKAAPQFQSDVIQPLKKGQKVDILRRQRAWYLVNTMQLEGWVNMLNVRYDIESINERSTSLLSILGLKKGHDNITATTGVRGIDVADLNAAEPSFEGLLYAEKFKANEKSARLYAQQIPLVSQMIKYQEVNDEND